METSSEILPTRHRSAGGRYCIARSECVPLSMETYDLCLNLEQLVQGFSRYHKRGLGAGP